MVLLTRVDERNTGSWTDALANVKKKLLKPFQLPNRVQWYVSSTYEVSDS